MSDAARLMDRIYARQRHIYDATRKFYLLGRDGLIEGLAPPASGTVLEIGCGTGRNLIKIARRYPSVACYGIDISEEMLATARRSVHLAGLDDRIRLGQGDATSFDPEPLFAMRTFDRVVMSYTLSMIPPWERVLARGIDLIGSDGSLHVVDFGDQARLPKAFKTALGVWLAAFHVSPRASLDKEIMRIAEERRLVGRARHLFRGYAMRAELVAGVASAS